MHYYHKVTPQIRAISTSTLHYHIYTGNKPRKDSIFLSRLHIKASRDSRNTWLLQSSLDTMGKGVRMCCLHTVLCQNIYNESLFRCSPVEARRRADRNSASSPRCPKARHAWTCPKPVQTAMRWSDQPTPQQAGDAITGQHLGL